MSTGNDQLLLCDTSRPKVRGVRFVQPDMRGHLDGEPIDQCNLFRVLRADVLDAMVAGETVILNFGLIDLFPTAFYRLLLRVNEVTKGANVRLLLCCLPPLAKEAFDLMGGNGTFAGQIHPSEARAVYAATHPAT
ncbi:MAG: hypothetical protein FJ304_12310 [Planctomycetes bacterium]|nr:hypothetical protein [Planctomycetota bacterium]